MAVVEPFSEQQIHILMRTTQEDLGDYGYMNDKFQIMSVPIDSETAQNPHDLERLLQRRAKGYGEVRLKVKMQDPPDMLQHSSGVLELLPSHLKFKY